MSQDGSDSAIDVGTPKRQKVMRHTALFGSYPSHSPAHFSTCIGAFALRSLTFFWPEGIDLVETRGTIHC